MQLTVLAEPGCPNAPLLKDRLTAVLDGRADVSVSQQVISDEGEAARWGMHGSPTLLIDGVDPFAEPGQVPSMSCRLYRDDNGQLSGAPSIGQLRQATGQALAGADGAGDPAWLDSLGRAGRGRVAPAGLTGGFGVPPRDLENPRPSRPVTGGRNPSGVAARLVGFTNG